MLATFSDLTMNKVIYKSDFLKNLVQNLLVPKFEDNPFKDKESYDQC